MADVFYVKNAKFYYARFNEPVLKYQAKPDPKNKYANKEYQVDILMPTKQLKEVRKNYKNSVASVKGMKTFTAEEFKERYKTDAPDPKVYANADGEYAIIKVKRHASYKDGKPTPKIDVFGVNSSEIDGKTVNRAVDINGNRITNKTLIGNGSTGTISIKVFTYDNGQSFQIDKVQIKDLVVYQQEDEFEGDPQESDYEDEDSEDEFDGDPEESDDDSDDDDDDGDSDDDDDDDDWDD